MKFWTHLESGLSNFGASLEKINQANRAHEEEILALGAIRDNEKIRMLKGDLYRAVRGSGEIRQIVEAIEVLEDLRAAEFKRKYSLQPQLEQLCNQCLLIFVAIAAGSYLATWGCGASRSKFCTYAHVIPDAVGQIFIDPR